MMSMVELFYGENEPIWVIGNSRHPVSPYTQPVREYVNPTYTDTHYATSAYMQPARDHEVRAQADRCQFNPYMQPARDHDIRGYSDRQPGHPYMRSSAPPPAHVELVPSNYTDRRFVSPYVQSAACDEMTRYVNRHHPAIPYMPYSARHEVPTTHTENSWPQQYPVSSTPASNLTQQLPLSNQTAASTRYKNPPSLELKVPLCCERCEERVKESLLDMDGVEGVLCDQTNQRVTVKGNVQPQRVLKRVKKIKKRSDFWLRDSRVLQQQQQQQQTGFGASTSYNPSQTLIPQQPSSTETY